MSQTITFVACGCKIQTSQTTELIPEKIIKTCKYHQRTMNPKATMQEKYDGVYNYSRSIVKAYEPMTEEKMSLVSEDIYAAAAAAARGEKFEAATKEQITKRIDELRKKTPETTRISK